MSQETPEEELELLEEIARRSSLLDDSDLVAAAWPYERVMDVIGRLHEKGWVDVSHPLTGDDRLMAARGIAISPTGSHVLALAVSTQGVHVMAFDDSSRLTVAQKRQRRAEFMNELYRITDGDRLARVSFRDIGTTLGWTEDEASAVANYLVDEGLAKWQAMGGLLGITHLGVVEVEELLQAPEKPTQHFAPLPHVTVNVHGDNHGPIQAGTHGSNQTVNQFEYTESIQQFLNELRPALDTLTDVVSRELALGSVELIEAEIAEGRPDSSLVRRLLPSLRNLALGIAASGAYDGLKAAAEGLPI